MKAKAGGSGGGGNYTAKNKIKSLGKSGGSSAVKKTTAGVKKATAVKKAVDKRAYSHLPKRGR